MRKNVYTCEQGHRTVTVDINYGVTPMFLICKTEGCGAKATSAMYPPNIEEEPTHEWFKPDDAYLERRYGYDEAILHAMTEHVNKGGLDIRRIKK